MCSALVGPIATDPTPISFEESMGLYVESLESQVRPTVIALRSRGWNTNSSGFGGPKGSQLQKLKFSGGVMFDDTVGQEVSKAGARLTVELYPDQVSYELEFKPEVADFDAITER